MTEQEVRQLEEDAEAMAELARRGYQLGGVTAVASFLIIWPTSLGWKARVRIERWRLERAS